MAAVLAAAVALALTMTTVACDDPSPAADPVGTTAATDVATTPPATTVDLLSSMAPLQIDSFSDQTQVEAAQDLLRAQQALQRALMEPVNPDLPDFVARFSGDALRREQAGIARNRDQHLAFDAPNRLNLRVETLETNADGSVRAVACETLGARFFNSETGETLSDNYFSQRVEYFLVQSTDHWTVSFEGRLDEGTDQATECVPR
jgi:hypothetical protein